jgi:hypothetical protein
MFLLLTPRAERNTVAEHRNDKGRLAERHLVRIGKEALSGDTVMNANVGSTKSYFNTINRYLPRLRGTVGRERDLSFTF